MTKSYARIEIEKDQNPSSNEEKEGADGGRKKEGKDRKKKKKKEKSIQYHGTFPQFLSTRKNLLRFR